MAGAREARRVLRPADKDDGVNYAEPYDDETERMHRALRRQTLRRLEREKSKKSVSAKKWRRKAWQCPSCKRQYKKNGPGHLNHVKHFPSFCRPSTYRPHAIKADD